MNDNHPEPGNESGRVTLSTPTLYDLAGPPGTFRFTCKQSFAGVGGVRVFAPPVSRADLHPG